MRSACLPQLGLFSVDLAWLHTQEKRLLRWFWGSKPNSLVYGTLDYWVCLIEEHKKTCPHMLLPSCSYSPKQVITLRKVYGLPPCEYSTDYYRIGVTLVLFCCCDNSVTYKAMYRRGSIFGLLQRDPSPSWWRGIAAGGRHSVKNRKLRAYRFNCKQETKRANRKWVWGLWLSKPTHSDVLPSFSKTTPSKHSQTAPPPWDQVFKY